LRVFLLPLGFHEDFLLRVLHEHRVSSGDVVYVLTCSPLAGGVRRAFEVFRATCAKQSFPEPVLEVLDCSDFYSSMRQVRGLIESVKGDIVVGAGSGMRIIGYIILLTLSFLGREAYIHYEPESSEGWKIIIPPSLFKLMARKPSGLELEVLKELIGRGEASAVDLARGLNRSEKTIRNILTRLRGMGLVEKGSGRGLVKPTGLALALYG